MLVLGIDPGTVVAGFGLVDNEDGNLKMVACGIIKSSQKLSPDQEFVCWHYSI